MFGRQLPAAEYTRSERHPQSKI